MVSIRRFRISGLFLPLQFLFHPQHLPLPPDRHDRSEDCQGQDR
jgi:hypothetical protein